MTGNGKTVIIGLDGVPFGMLKDFAEAGVMANTAELISRGIFKKMYSSIPEISSVAWPSIITGQNPGQHSIFGFTDLFPDSYKMRFPNFNDLKSPPFWSLAKDKSVIINVPSTYPVKDMNGVHISGFVSIDINKSVHPAFLIPQLESLGYRIDVDSEKAHTDLNLFLEDLDETLTARIKAAEYLWDYIDWQTFMLTFTGTDRLMHFLWDAYEDKDHKYHDAFLEHFHKIDQAIGEIYSKLAENDVFLMLSDHGFEKLEKDVYVNHLLASEGFLTFRPNTEPKLVNIDSATKAFVLDPARIYINQKGKYPAGSVEADDKDACVGELESLFQSLQIDGRKVIKYIYRKQDIYAGPYLENAPELVLIAEKGFNLKGSMTTEKLTDKGPFTGKHTYEDAFLLLNDKDIATGLNDQISVIDAGKLIKSLGYVK
jgi:predicted AlkP superfamily phosphohydrolase/phosphomutase